MNAVMTQVTSVDHIRRSEMIKRRNAEAAYDRNVKYNSDNQKTLSKLEELITGKSEIASGQKNFEKLDAGQVKQIALPTGKTLEESINLWKDIRSGTLSVPEPTTADHHLVAKTSSKIRQAEAQIGLNKQAVKAAPIELTSSSTGKSFELQKRYERAISSYSFQVQAKDNGFKINWPSFFKVA